MFFLKYLSRLSKFDQKAQLFFKYYLLYAFLISIVYLLQCVVMVLLGIDCYTGVTGYVYNAMSKTGNILILINPIVCMIIIGFHPEFKNKFIPQLCKICYKKK